MIKSNYITNVLCMTTEEFDDMYPGMIKMCKQRINNIKNSLREIDLETGLTKHQLSVCKSKITLGKLNDNGVSGYIKRGQKTRETHLNAIDSYGHNGYERISISCNDKKQNTRFKRGLNHFKNQKDFNRMYRYIVDYLTTKNDNKPSGDRGLYTYHLDHIYSIKDGRDNKISPYVLSHESNLQIISAKENRKKRYHSRQSLEKLLNDAEYTLEKANYEYDIISLIICENINNNKNMTVLEMLDDERWKSIGMC